MSVECVYCGNKAHDLTCPAFLARELRDELSEKYKGIVCVGVGESQGKYRLVVYITKKVKTAVIPETFRGLFVDYVRTASPKPIKRSK